MRQAESESVPTPPDRLVRGAVDDSELRQSLLRHALAILGRLSPTLSPAQRQERAAEACQETYLRGLQKSGDFDPSLPVAPWLHGILNNVLSEAHRANRRPPVSTGDAGWDRVRESLDAAQTVPGRLDAESYLSKLPAEHVQMLRLRFFDGLSHEEIAIRLGISAGNARVRLCRALAAAKDVAGASADESREDRR